MRSPILPSDVILNDASFLRIAVDSVDQQNDDRTFLERLDLNRERALERLKADPLLGAKLLSLGSPNSTIYWTGDYATSVSGGETVGMKVLRKRDGDEVVGDNVFGRFLYNLRLDYREYLEKNAVVEVPVRKDQVIADFTPHGVYRSVIQEREEAGRQYIHVDPYVPARFRFDTAMDGTTGHAQRRSDDEVPFKKFVCPFGTGYPYPVVVGSAAEASMLFEKALRGELDWKALFRDLSQRGLLDAKFTERWRTVMIDDLKAQFAWMREQISSDPSLARRQIVAPSFLVPDASMGRSVYDPVYAPSPAHVLARYINNPVLLYSSSDNGVARSLSEQDKREPERIRLSGKKDSVTLLVVGSDTIGGREPGTRGKSRIVTETVLNDEGKEVEARSKQYTITFKSKEATEADYKAFAERMDTILSDLPDGTKVTLVTGGASSYAGGVGVGTPRLVERYVSERNGKNLSYNLYNGKMVESDREARYVNKDVLRLDFESVTMEHLSECLPVLVGDEKSATFLMRDGDENSEVTFPAGELGVDGCVCFSADGDTYNRNVLSMGSFVASAGKPVIHVMDNLSEQEQRDTLRSGAALSRADVSGDVEIIHPLFVGSVPHQWGQGLDMMSVVDSETMLAVPFVSERFREAVTVGAQSFHSAFGAFVGHLAVALDRKDLMPNIAAAEGSTADLVGVYRLVAGDGLSPELEERCMRRAVRQMASASTSFADRLLSSGNEDILMVSSTDDVRLFANVDGYGENRFGMVLTAERNEMRELREAQRREAEFERQQVLEENVRRQKADSNTHAEGEKVQGGFPATAEAARDAVWLLGTSRPGQLALDVNDESFCIWDDGGGAEPLSRAVAEDPKVRADEVAVMDNRFIYIFPSDLTTVQGRRKVYNQADSRDLTGVTRKDPKTGVPFVCAFGLPVKMNNRFNEFYNPENLPCSFRLDNESSAFLDSVIWTDTAARTAALKHDMSLCMLSRTSSRGETYFPIAQVFMDKIYDKKTKSFVDNPHKAPLNKEIIDRYTNLLLGSKRMPLNCICLAEDDYHFNENVPGNREMMERRFLSDLLFSLRLADSTAKAMGMKLRIPLDAEGHVDFGPGVPEEFREAGERRVDSFIGVVNTEELWKGALPEIGRISIVAASKYRDSLVKCPSCELHMGANDLARAFGGYDFSFILNGSSVGDFGADGGRVAMAPLHEMAFKMSDGTVFTIVDSKTTRGMTPGEINKYLRYERNDERRFIVKSTDPEKAPAFVAALKEYVARAKGVQVEMRLLAESDREVKDNEYNLNGYVDLLSSNSDEFVTDEHQIGREASIHNDAFKSRFEGNENDSVYYGKVDAGDGFKGYAQYRYILPDGTQSPWVKVDNQALAKDIVMSLVHRTYRTDQYSVPSDTALRMLVTAEAVRHAGEAFRAMEGVSLGVKAEDAKVVSLEGMTHSNEELPEVPQLEPDSEGGKVYVSYWGSRNVPENAVLVQISTSAPDDVEVDVEFTPLFPDYNTMVKPHKEGKIDDKGYAERYNESVLQPDKEYILNQLNEVIEDARKEGRDVVLMCYERPGEFCHRYLVNNFLNENGIECQEVPGDRMRYKEGHVKLFGEEGYEPMVEPEAPAQELLDVVFTESEGGYQQRTRENATADDVNFTIGMAVDFSTYGERATMKAAGDSFVKVDIPILPDGGIDLSKKAVSGVVSDIKAVLPDEFFKGAPCGVNLAGNGIYTLTKKGVTQDQANRFVTLVLAGLRNEGLDIAVTRSGGQSGMDLAGTAASMALGIPTTVHAPKGWQFRDVNNVDHDGEKAFKERFGKVDLKALAKLDRTPSLVPTGRRR